MPPVRYEHGCWGERRPQIYPLRPVGPEKMSTKDKEERELQKTHQSHVGSLRLLTFLYQQGMEGE